MSIYVGTSEIKNVYVGTTPAKAVYVGTTKVRPPILEYDFTQSDGGWTASSLVSRNSSGFYIYGRDVDGYIFPPSEIYNNTPKKIQIIFNRPDSNGGTGIFTGSGNYWYLLPRKGDIIRLDWSYNGTITQNNISLGTGNITWELDIDSSTTNRTITHKITGNNDITESSGVLKYMWENQLLGVRIVHWSPSNYTYIKKVIVTY